MNGADDITLRTGYSQPECIRCGQRQGCALCIDFHSGIRWALGIMPHREQAAAQKVRKRGDPACGFNLWELRPRIFFCRTRCQGVFGAPTGQQGVFLSHCTHFHEAFAEKLQDLIQKRTVEYRTSGFKHQCGKLYLCAEQLISCDSRYRKAVGIGLQ